MIQSDRLGGEQTRLLVARLSMSHLVPLLEFNHYRVMRDSSNYTTFRLTALGPKMAPKTGLIIYELQFRKAVVRNRDPFETFLFGRGILRSLLPRVLSVKSISAA
jgi:hypothetical protein